MSDDMPDENHSVEKPIAGEPATQDEEKRAERKLVGLFQVASAIRRIVVRALDGDAECGFFLGEMIPILAKTAKDLESNSHFKKRVSEMRSSQRPRKTGQTLRKEIEDIIHETRSQCLLLQLSSDDDDNGSEEGFLTEARKDINDLERREKLLARSRKRIPDSKWFPCSTDSIRNSISDLKARLEKVTSVSEVLKDLPEFDSLSADEWFEKVIWPELERREPQLRDNALIGGLKKAIKSGKFQLSDLKPQARETVGRVASSSHAYIFW